MASFLQTHTSEQQHDVELKVAELYQDLAECDAAEREELLLLLRDRHTRYLQGGLGQLPAGFVSLDASKPWICYWILHGLALLDNPLPRSITEDQIIAFLSSCQHPTGGYGGGPGQLPHLAPTYAAISALLTLGGLEAYRCTHDTHPTDTHPWMAYEPKNGVMLNCVCDVSSNVTPKNHMQVW
jgi:protein farnesyltransferase subunit beta